MSTNNFLTLRVEIHDGQLSLSRNMGKIPAEVMLYFNCQEILCCHGYVSLSLTYSRVLPKFPSIKNNLLSNKIKQRQRKIKDG